MEITEAVYYYFLRLNKLEDNSSSKLLFEVERDNMTNRFCNDDNVIVIPSPFNDGLELLFLDKTIDKKILI